MIINGQNGQNGKKVKMVTNGRKWSTIVKSGQVLSKWSKMVKKVKNGKKW